MTDYRMSDDDILAAAAQIVARKLRHNRGEKFNHPRLVKEYLSYRIGNLEHEEFHLLVLDNYHRLLSENTFLFRGTIDCASVYPREVVKHVLCLNGSRVILAHNHPSGSIEPSNSDRNITERLKDALALIDVRVLDHIIIGDGSYSFAEMGLI